MPGTTRKEHAVDLRQRIIAAMRDLPFVATMSDRRMLLRLIRLEVIDFPEIPQSDEAHRHILEIVLACLSHPGGLRALGNAIETMDSGTRSSRRVLELIKSANLLALLPEEAINEARALLAQAPAAEVADWRTTFRALDGGSDRGSRTASRLSLVDGFEILCRKPSSPIPPGLAFVDELARKVDGQLALDLLQWVEAQARQLGVQTELAASRPDAEVLEEPDRPNGSFTPESGQTNVNLNSPHVSTKTSSPELDEEGDPPVGAEMPPVEALSPAKQKLPLVWGGIPPRNPHFTGREASLEYLHAKLQTLRKAAVLPQALHGMGGVGKSQMAIEYVHRHRADYDLIWWVPADREADILASLAELAFRLKLDMTRQANNAVPVLLDALNTGQIPYENWLLIFDNAEDVPEAQQYFPTGGSGTILVTSRNLDWAQAAEEFIEVDVFTPDESRTFLQNRARGLTSTDADRLGEALGYLPLAVEQAASWHAVTGMPVSEYLQLLEAKRMELLSQSPRAHHDEGSVAAAWDMSLDRLKQKNPAALQLLQVCSFFAPSDISRDLFVAPQVSITPELDKLLGDGIQVARAIRDIQGFALARLNHRDSTLQIHRLIQAVLVARLSDAEREVMRYGAHALLVNADPKHPARPEQWVRYQMLYKHFQASRVAESADPLTRGLTIHTVEFLYYWGAHAECREAAQKAHDTWTRELGLDDPHNLQLATWLGYIRRLLGEFTQAAAINRKTLEAYERGVGPDDEWTINAGRMVCGDLRAAGRFREARDRDEVLYNRARDLFGADDPPTLHAAHDLGVSLRLTGEYARAIELDADTAQRRSEVLGANHNETLRTLNGLAIDRREAGEFIEAHRLQEGIYQRHLEIMGEDTALSLMAAMNLAVARRKAGDHSGAKELAEITVDKFRRRYGEGYPETMAAVLNYAIDLRQVGQLEEARELGSTLLVRYQRTLGVRHPHVLSAQTNLAIVIRLLGDPETAQALDRKTYEELSQEDVLGPDHPVTLTCATNLASDLYALGEALAAYELDSDTLEHSQRVLGDEHPSVLACSANLALDLRMLGRAAEADKIQGNTMALFRKVLGDKHPATLNALQSIRADCDIDPMPI